MASLARLNKGLNMDTVKVLKTQDLGYVTMKRMAEKKKVERLENSLAFVGTFVPVQPSAVVSVRSLRLISLAKMTKLDLQVMCEKEGLGGPSFTP